MVFQKTDRKPLVEKQKSGGKSQKDETKTPIQLALSKNLAEKAQIVL